MKIRLICFGLLLNCLLYHTYAQHFVCNSLDGYETKALTSATQWQVKTHYQCLSNLAGNCTFYISFCQPAPMCFNEYSACEKTSESTNMTIIGNFTSTVFHENESGPKGFYAKFPNGPEQNITNTTRCAPSLKIKFNCNLRAIWFAPVDNETASAPHPTSVEIDNTDHCLTIMTFDYAGACYYGKEPERGLTGGGIFLIILFSVAFVYFVVGIGYNAFVKHRSGIHLLPQAHFWIGLPLSAIEGCRATLSICTGSSAPSRATYESV